MKARLFAFKLKRLKSAEQKRTFTPEELNLLRHTDLKNLTNIFNSKRDNLFDAMKTRISKTNTKQAIRKCLTILKNLKPDMNS
jgi:hypothetical protein